MNRGFPGAAVLMIAGLGLACGQPQFRYDTPPHPGLRGSAKIALDPRTDYLYLLEGKRQVRDPEVQRQVLAELQAKGYRMVPPAEADLWVTAFLFISAGRPRTGAPAPSRGSGGGHGGHAAGFEGFGGHGDGASHGTGSEMDVLVELLARPSMERAWFGMGEVRALQKGPEHPKDSPLGDTVKRLLDPFPSPTRARAAEAAP